MFNNMDEILTDLETTDLIPVLSAKIQVIFMFPVFQAYHKLAILNDNTVRYDLIIGKLIAGIPNCDPEEFAKLRNENKILIDQFEHKIKQSKWLQTFKG